MLMSNYLCQVSLQHHQPKVWYTRSLHAVLWQSASPLGGITGTAANCEPLVPREVLEVGSQAPGKPCGKVVVVLEERLKREKSV